MSLAPDRLAIGIRRHYTTPGVHPYDQVVWEKRDARISNWKDGSVAFEQLGVEFPVTWSLNATNIVAQKYFRGTPGTAEREQSLKQVIDRVAEALIGLHAMGLQEAAWVTHAGVVRAALYLKAHGPRTIAAASDWPREAPAPGGFTLVEF